MRKLKLQMQVTLDGFNSTGPDDEQAWVTWDLSAIRGHVLDLFDSSDTIVMGRKLAEGYIPFWREALAQDDHPMRDFAIRIAAASKIVFTRTLRESPWEDAELATGDLCHEIGKLKAEPGKDLVVYGGSSFAASLVREELIDEFHFFVNPIAIGRGESVFAGLAGWQRLELLEAVPCGSGIVLLRYARQ